MHDGLKPYGSRKIKVVPAENKVTGKKKIGLVCLKFVHKYYKIKK